MDSGYQWWLFCCNPLWISWSSLEIRGIWSVFSKISLYGLLQWGYLFRALGAYMEILSSKEMFFFPWLAAHNRCWTSDRIAHRGLPHPKQCPLCDQEYEIIQHSLTNCLLQTSLVFTLTPLWFTGPLSTSQEVFCESGLGLIFWFQDTEKAE